MKMKRMKQKRENLLKLREIGRRFNLNFCKYAAIGNKLMGLDGKKRKLLVTGQDHVNDESHIIDLENVKSVSFVKHYGSIRAGELSKKRFDDFLHFIHLKFEHHGNTDPTNLSFYNRQTDGRLDVKRLIMRSRLLQNVLSKLIASNRVIRSDSAII